jgi:hypothetical protein
LRGAERAFTGTPKKCAPDRAQEAQGSRVPARALLKSVGVVPTIEPEPEKVIVAPSILMVPLLAVTLVEPMETARE